MRVVGGQIVYAQPLARPHGSSGRLGSDKRYSVLMSIQLDNSKAGIWGSAG